MYLQAQEANYTHFRSLTGSEIGFDILKLNDQSYEATIQPQWARMDPKVHNHWQVFNIYRKFLVEV